MKNTEFYDPERDFKDDIYDEVEVKPDKKRKNRKRRDTVGNVVIAVLIIIILMLLLRSCRASPQVITTGGSMDVDTRATSQIEEMFKGQENERDVYFAGINDAVINEKTKVLLENLPENEDYLMKYEIYNVDTDEKVFETDLIPSGSHIVWMAGEDLGEAGTYNLLFVESPFAPLDDGTYEPLTVGRNTVTFTVR